jgi:hypothetical protein
MLAKINPETRLDTGGDAALSSSKRASELLEQAARCRRLARATTDPSAAQILDAMARDYSASAASVRTD